MTEVAWSPPQKDGDGPRPYRSEMPKPPMDNQTVCMIETSKFVVTTPPPKFAVRPVMMPPLPRSA